MEFLLKTAISVFCVIVIYFQIVLVITVWKSQIDPMAAFSRFLRTLKPQADLTATRDPAKI